MFLFAQSEKRWWILPLFLLLGVLLLVFVFLEGSAIAPFLYPLF